jgi:two-component system chemotaxis response regulator CheY
MHILIVEDDMASSRLLARFLQHVGEIHAAMDGEAGLDAFRTAFTENRPFNLVLLDIMMPKLDGQGVLKEIRMFETQHAVAAMNAAKIIMTTALNDKVNFVAALPRCDAYLTKPIDRTQLMFYIKKFGLFSEEEARLALERETKRREEKKTGGDEKEMPWVG